jgi:hypothetical protein
MISPQHADIDRPAIRRLTHPAGATMPDMISATFAAMLAISGVGYLLLPKDARVPMQWDLAGKPTWKAPKLIAVLFSPILSLFVLSAFSFASASNPQKVEAILPLVAGAFLVVHVLHLALAQWHFNANKS